MFQCKLNTNGFSIEIKHYAGGMGLTVYYSLTEESVQVSTDCDLSNCKRKTVYYRPLTTSMGDSLVKIFKSLHLDTLKKHYASEEMSTDGLISDIKFQGIGPFNHGVSVENANVPALDSLYKTIDNLILEKKYKFYSFGQN